MAAAMWRKPIVKSARRDYCWNVLFWNIHYFVLISIRLLPCHSHSLLFLIVPSCDSSWHGTCGDSLYCNELQSNCERDCIGTWSARSSGGNSSPTPAPIATTEPPIPSTPVPITTPSGPSSTGGTTELGELTWWTSSYSDVQGGSCEYAHVDSVYQGDLWNVPYIHTGMHCAVSSDLFNDGEGCGKCFELDYGGKGGTNPASAGSAIIQVTNSGAGGSDHFDCFDNAFYQLTGITTGIFPISYREMDCPQATNVYIVVLGGSNPWYIKVLVAGGHTSVSAMSIELDGRTISMGRNSGATWIADGLDNRKGPARFVVTFSDGSTETVGNCFPEWPHVGTGTQCSS